MNKQHEHTYHKVKPDVWTERGILFECECGDSNWLTHEEYDFFKTTYEP